MVVFWRWILHCRLADGWKWSHILIGRKDFAYLKNLKWQSIQRQTHIFSKHNLWPLSLKINPLITFQLITYTGWSRNPCAPAFCIVIIRCTGTCWSPCISYISYRCADKSLAWPGRKEARKHVRDARDFNNIETWAVINFFFSLQGKAPKEIHAILTETLNCFLPGRAMDLSAPLYSLPSHSPTSTGPNCTLPPFSGNAAWTQRKT